MTTVTTSGVPSKAAIGGHPIHPMLVPFPIAFLIGALVSDLVFWRLAEPFWAQASFWLLTAGLVTGAVAAVFGLVEFIALKPVRELAAAWVHFLGNAVALVIAFINVWLRVGDPATAIVPLGLVLSAAVVLIFGVTGWLGGELVFRHGIGVAGGASATNRRP